MKNTNKTVIVGAVVVIIIVAVFGFGLGGDLVGGWGSGGNM